jgi:hypothetical protein
MHTFVSLIQTLAAYEAEKECLPKTAQELEEFLGHPIPRTAWGDEIDYYYGDHEPPTFTISTMTPDLMIYRYNSANPGNGVIVEPF